VGNGTATFFWTDPWQEGCCTSDMAPDLATVVPARRGNNITVLSALSGNAWLTDIARPLTLPVLVHYVQIRERIDAIQLNLAVQDKMVWCWCSSGDYSSSSAYEAMFYGQSQMLGAK
jgi:hypothetical protein